ncbi:SET domain-containing protein [Candidatus Parcubacteria bacterium]|nr:SET domain-containing protein [Candidatus Parcubacteria bacterium]
MKEYSGLTISKSRTGKGIFTTRSFKRGSLLFIFGGKLYAADNIFKIGGTIADNSIRFGPETYMSPENELGSFLNHSCEPNSLVSKEAGRLKIVALKDISKGSEVTIDYSTILGADDIWTMKCICGAPRCRKLIRSIDTLPKALIDEYVSAGAIPRYILDTMKR